MQINMGKNQKVVIRLNWQKANHNIAKLRLCFSACAIVNSCIAPVCVRHSLMRPFEQGFQHTSVQNRLIHMALRIEIIRLRGHKKPARVPDSAAHVLDFLPLLCYLLQGERHSIPHVRGSASSHGGTGENFTRHWHTKSPMLTWLSTDICCLRLLCGHV